MNIIKERVWFFQTLESFVPKQVKKLWCFGWQALTTVTITSLRSNARLLGLNWHTAKTKAWRLTQNLKFLALFPQLMALQGLVSPKDCIAVDFSDFGEGKQVLMFAKQTQSGRAIPVYFEILQYPITKNSQNTFVIQALEHFVDMVGFQPCLVFDRGFASPWIVSYLCRKSWKFLLRIKGMKTVIHSQSGTALKVRDSDQNDNDFLTLVYGHSLRAVISDIPAGGGEPWYLLTNDIKASRAKLIRRYYHRFEIEEFFRDAKRLLGLEWVRCKTIYSLSIVLWFVILGCWFFWYLEGTNQDNQEQEQKLRTQMGLSVVRYWFEQLRAQLYACGLKAALENSA